MKRNLYRAACMLALFALPSLATAADPALTSPCEAKGAAPAVTAETPPLVSPGPGAAAPPAVVPVTTPPATSAARPIDATITGADLDLLKQRIDQLEEGQRRLLEERNTLQTQVDDLNRKLAEVVTQNGSNLSVNLLGKMQSNPDFRDEVMRSTQGKLLIENVTLDPQTVIVNGRTMTLQPGKFFMWVPYGRVTTQLNNDPPQTFGPDHWHFVPGDPKNNDRGNYEMTLRVSIPSTVIVP